MMYYISYLLGAQAILLLAMGQEVNGVECSPGKNMEVVYEWKFIDFEFPSKEARKEAIKNGEYDPRNVTAYDINVYEDMYFVTTPRFKYGVPATLSTISDKMRDGQYLLKPFPDWESNRQGNCCGGLTSVFTTQIDQFGRIWILDAGTVDALGKLTRICQPKLVVYDLTAGDKLVGTYLIDDSVLDCNSQLHDFEVDCRNGQRDDVFVYIVDSLGRHLVVFDLSQNLFYRITDDTFLPDPHAADFIVAGIRIFGINGIYSVTLGPICDNDRRVYYHVLNSLEECYVMASTLRDPAFVTNERAFPDSFYCFSKKRPSQCGPEVMTEDGIMFYQQTTLNAIFCWNSEIDYNMENTAIVARNDTTLQSALGLKLVGTELYALSSRIQLFIYNLLSDREINYRVLRASVDSLICGTPCTKPCPGNESVCNN